MAQHEYTSARDSEAGLGFLVVEIGGERYGIPSANVREIVRHRPWTVVPGAPPTLPGIISQRGIILPIVDLRALLELPDVTLGRTARFVVVQHQDVDMALLVEMALDLTSIPVDTIEHGVLNGARRGRAVRGLAHAEGLPLALLDLDAVVALLREGG
ncbi:MAG: purine-binding chemotaxis protein CheW [Roseiflexaceae bacterium]|nr:purine-binding chemotaxis protein CheW [Roseiflexaceae bacterium]